MKQKFLIAILCLGLLTIYLACQKDDAVPSEQNANPKIPKIETISYEDSKNTIFNNLKAKYNLDNHKTSRFSNNIQAKTTMDTLGLIIETDIIKQVTLGDYTSYTMKIVDQDSIVFYNLTIEYKNGASDMFITKYIPTEYWRNNKDEVFQGEVQSKRVELTEYTDPEDAFEEYDNTDDPNLGSGYNGGGSDYFSNWSVHYPNDCFGVVLVDFRETEIPCSCYPQHMPGEFCNCDQEGGTLPRTEIIPYYSCQEYLGDPIGDDPYDPGNGNPGGGGLDPDPIPDDPAVTATIKDEECTTRPTGDLDGDCDVDAIDCELGGNGPEVCECVNTGNELNECSTIYDCIGIENSTELLQLDRQDRTKIFEFINANGCSDATKEFVELAIEALDNDGVDDGEVDFDDNVILSEDFKNNTKLKCVYDKLAGDNSTLFRDTVGAFVGNRSVNLILEIGKCILTDDACAQTQYVEETGIITITIEDINADPIEIAQMILHEAIHAELAKYVLEHDDEVDTDDHPRLFELYKFYRALDVPEHHLDHPYMALNYITPLASALRAYDNNSYPLDHYKGFAWDGLEKWDVNNVLDIPLVNEYNNFKTIVTENSDVCI